MKSAAIVTIVCSPLVALAQSPKEERRMPNSLDPGISKPSFYAPARQDQKKSSGPTVETYEQYVARMKRTVKAIKKNEKVLRRPQYSNPLYFGHKRKPRKHKAGKLKFCKECGIRH